MRAILVGALVLSLTGCAGTMFDGRLCSIATDEDAQKDVAAVVDLYTDDNEKAAADKYLRTARITGTVACELLRSKQSAQ